MTICLLYQRLHLKDLLFSLEEQSATELKIIHGGEFEKSIFMQSRACGEGYEVGRTDIYCLHAGAASAVDVHRLPKGAVKVVYCCILRHGKHLNRQARAARKSFAPQKGISGPRGGSRVWIIPRKGDTPFLIHPARTSFVNILHTHGLENILA